MLSQEFIFQKTILSQLKAIAAAGVSALTISACAVNPTPLAKAEISSFATAKLNGVTKNQESVVRPISLYEAVARALKYDLDQRVELAQQSLRAQELNLANYQGLPNLVASSGYTGRNNDYGGTDISLLNGQESLVPSTGQTRNDVISDATLSWNVLDFGLSYVKAQQASDQVLIAKEARRKVLARIVEDVRTAYWRAVASQRLSTRLHALEARTRGAIADSRQLFDSRLTSPITALTYERELIEIEREAQHIDGELAIARTQLAALMNLPPDAHFDLEDTLEPTPRAQLPSSNRQLVQIALENRSEIREVMYKSLINEKEAEAALLELLPGVNLFVGADNDSNKLLYNSNWVGWGAKASWNLIKVFKYPQTKRVIQTQGALLDERALALTMAIMTQVYVSEVRYAHAQQELRSAAKYRDIEHRLIEQIRASAQTDKLGEQALIREEMNLVVADVKYDLAYADVQNAYANIYASLGVDAFPADNIETTSVAALSASLRNAWRHMPPLRASATPKASLKGDPQSTSTSALQMTASAAPIETRLGAEGQEPPLAEIAGRPFVTTAR